MVSNMASQKNINSRGWAVNGAKPRSSEVGTMVRIAMIKGSKLESYQAEAFNCIE